jgi:hypothetical protein
VLVDLVPTAALVVAVVAVGCFMLVVVSLVPTAELLAAVVDGPFGVAFVIVDAYVKVVTVHLG